MNQQTMHNLTLFDLLARSWQRPAAVTDVRFSADGSTAAFAALDGTVAIAPVADGEPPDARIRVSGDLGQTTIRPRQKSAPPLVSTLPFGSGPAAVVPFDGSDFLVGTTTGEVLRLKADGEVAEPSLKFEGGIVALDHSARSGTTAATDGATIMLARPDGDTFRLATDAASPVATVALSPGGDHLAFAGGDRVSVWIVGDEIMPLDSFACDGQPTSIRWSEQAPLLACAFGKYGLGVIDLARGRTDAVRDFPAPVRSVCWSRPSNSLLASGAFRIAGWTTEAPPLSPRGALETGRAGLVPVEVVAAHPSRKLAAAGYANGQIVVAQIGTRDELIVRGAGGRVTALAWSPDGNHLAVGDADGDVAIITFPAQMFK